MLVVNKLKNRDSVVDLEAKAVEEIIDDDHVLEVTVLDNPEVLDEESILRLHAVLPRQDVADVLIFRIDVIDNRVSIVLGRCRENNDLIFLTHVLKKLH